MLHNLIASGFEGPVFAVNPSAETVQSLPAWPSVSEIPGELDLAVLAVRAAGIAAVARECAAKGARGLVVLSAGFSEIGAEGAERERELLAICREAGMQADRPQLPGDPQHRARAPASTPSFAPTAPPAGDVGFVTQSGALGLALIDFATSRNLGVSSFASIGNRADITATDLLEYWEDDERTRVALLYIESFTNPRRFARVTQRVGRRKPVVVVKSGRSAAGARAAGSHTGALLAASDRTTDALFEQSGVIRAETLAELLDVASLLSGQPLPAGPRVGILTNAGGPAIMCADTCEAVGLEVPPLPEKLQDRLRGFLAAEASAANPVDMIATATAEQYRRAIGELASWDGIDALIVIFIRPLSIEAAEIAAGVQGAVAEMKRKIPVQAVFMSPADHAALAGSAELPIHLYPEDAARALGKVARYVRWRERPEPPAVDFADLRGDEAAAILAEALAAEREWLGAEECARLLDCYGIAMPESLTAASPQAAGEAAERLGGAVALKAHGPRILHKTELGAVRTGLEGADEVAGAAARDGRGPGPGRGRARGVSRAADDRGRGRAAGRGGERPGLRPRGRLRRRRHRGRAARRRLGARLPAERRRRGRDDPLAGDLPDAGRLPRHGPGRPRRPGSGRPAGRRPRRLPPRDRRARPQPGDRDRGWGVRGRRPGTNRRATPGPPLAGHLVLGAGFATGCVNLAIYSRSC